MKIETASDKMETFDTLTNFEQREGIRLTRNASNIYQWEIKILDLDIKKLISVDDEIRKELDSRGLKYIKEEKK